MVLNEMSVQALKKFQEKKTSNKDVDKRFEAMGELVQELSEVYEIACPRLRMKDIDGSYSGGSTFDPDENIITMRGKLSIITLLHEFAHALLHSSAPDLHDTNRRDSEGFCRIWSVLLFKTVYPEQFAKLYYNGGSYIRQRAA